MEGHGAEEHSRCFRFLLLLPLLLLSSPSFTSFSFFYFPSFSFLPLLSSRRRRAESSGFAGDEELRFRRD